MSTASQQPPLNWQVERGGKQRNFKTYYSVEDLANQGAGSTNTPLLCTETKVNASILVGKADMWKDEPKKKTLEGCANIRPGQKDKQLSFSFCSNSQDSSSLGAEEVPATSAAPVGLKDLSRDQIKATILEELAVAPAPTKADEKPAQKEQLLSPRELLEPFAVTDEYISKLGKEEFLIPDLVIKGHVITIIAMPGGGKTTYMYYHVAPILAQHGLTVWYIDADSPVSDHPRMKACADQHGFKFLNPDVNLETGVRLLFEKLHELATGDYDLSGYVFFFDTLKKFADLMSKQSIKDFYVLCRNLTHKGATVVLLGHANKFRDKDGFLVFEGCGDVRSDSDELIYFERKSHPMGGISVTTVVDHDRNAKVRGIFKPFSFYINESREISFYDNPLELTDPAATATVKATDEELLKVATTYLFEMNEPVMQKHLVQHVADMTATGVKRVRQVITQNSEPKKNLILKGFPIVLNSGERNSIWYELPDPNFSLAGAE